MKAEIKLDSCTNYAEVTIIEDDMAEQKKTIPLQDLREVFRIRDKQTYFCPCSFFQSYETNAKKPGLLYGIDSGDTTKGIFFLPATQRHMNFAGERNILPYPSLIFYLTESRGTLQSSKCFALKVRSLNQLSMNSVLYAFPFGNVLPSDGHICWGSNKTTGIRGFDGLRTAVETFLFSESNMDYIQKDSFQGYSSYTSLLQDLKSKSDFPSQALMPSPCFHTMRELFNNLF